MDITKKIVFLTAWLSFLFAEIWGLLWDMEFFAALERALWFAFIMGGLGWLAGMLWEGILREIHYLEEEKANEGSSITGVDYTLPEDLPPMEEEGKEPTIPETGSITAASFDEELKKLSVTKPDDVAKLVKTELGR